MHKRQFVPSGSECWTKAYLEHRQWWWKRSQWSINNWRREKVEDLFTDFLSVALLIQIGLTCRKLLHSSINDSLTNIFLEFYADHLFTSWAHNSFMDIETDTNPIDRSVAHLLFHRPSEPSPPSAQVSLPFKPVSFWVWCPPLVLW